VKPAPSKRARTIHVATVHWRSERWIDIQRRYFERYLSAPYRVYAFLNDVPGDHADKFSHISREAIKNHPTKLNLLCEVICSAADDPSDVLLVLDGDAFPVTPIVPVLDDLLESHRLIAVQRLENHGDLQPHPSFCATTVGFWTAIRGDWRKGYKWLNEQDQPETQVGGNLLGQLERAGVDWYPLRRVNRVNLHPLFFGLYGDARHGPVAYHHGAGFHTGVGRDARELARAQAVENDERARSEIRRQMQHKKKTLSKQVFDRISTDEEFWREFA
jgi:hypothetical protein